MPQVFRGKAQVSGLAMSIDVILYPSPHDASMDHQFGLDAVQDQNGDDCAWRTRNEMIDGDITCHLIDRTGSPTIAHAKAGAAFLAPLAVVTISSSDVTAWNTTWTVVPGSKIDLKNEGTGSIAFKLRRYVDSTQNALLATTPS